VSLIGFLVSAVITGLIIGGLARLALPGRDPMSIPMTIGIGLAGSFVGGAIAAAIGSGLGLAIALQVLVATGFVYLLRRRRGERVL
jgi:uncharacterized membrane protein YeaQ/YmgE (transglycosylase-associated protein family)